MGVPRQSARDFEFAQQYVAYRGESTVKSAPFDFFSRREYRHGSDSIGSWWGKKTPVL